MGQPAGFSQAAHLLMVRRDVLLNGEKRNRCILWTVCLSDSTQPTVLICNAIKIAWISEVKMLGGRSCSGNLMAYWQQGKVRPQLQDDEPQDVKIYC